MEKYKIYCSEEQTRKALKLGAPLFKYTSIPNFAKVIEIAYCEYYEIPTAEEMIGWLNEQGIAADVIFIEETKTYKAYCSYNCYISTDRSEATLATIDKALEYLANNKY